MRILRCDFFVPTAAISFTNCPLGLVPCLVSSLVVSHVESSLPTTTVMYYGVAIVVKKPKHLKIFSSESEPRKKNQNYNNSSMLISCLKMESEILLKQMREFSVGEFICYSCYRLCADSRGGLCRLHLVF